MIIAFVQKNYKDIVVQAYEDAKSTKDLGVAYVHIDNLVNYIHAENDEDIYVTAHGNSAEIGDEDGYGVTASVLAKIITDKFIGGNWNAGIYISACESYPTFASDFKKAFGKGRVFGMQGSIDLETLPNSNPLWKEV